MKLFLKRGENRSFFFFFFFLNFLCMLLLHVCSLLSICFYFHTCIDVLFWVFQGRQVHFNQDLLPPFVTSELEVLVMEIKALLEGSRSSTNWASYESTSKEVQGCTQRTHPRVMGSSKFVEAHWAWSTWATKNRHLDSSSRRIRSRLRIGKKYFGSILEGLGCMAILGATFFPFMLSFVSFYMTLGVQPLLPYMSCVF